MVACDGHGPSVHQVLALGRRWVPEPGLRRLVHAAALPEETAILDNSDLRSFGHPLFGRRFVAHDPGVVTWGTAVVSAFPASTSVPSSMRTRSDPISDTAGAAPYKARCRQ
jgi:hypothetical protein